MPLFDVQYVNGLSMQVEHKRVHASNAMDAQALVGFQSGLPAVHFRDSKTTEVTDVTADSNTCLVLRYRNLQVKAIRSFSEFPADGMGLDVADVVKVTASGNYLKLVRLQFKGLPDVTDSVICDTVSWYGDTAKFIVGNLTM